MGILVIFLINSDITYSVKKVSKNADNVGKSSHYEFFFVEKFVIV